MEYIGQILNFIQKLFIWWVTVLPWERGVHVRMGKRVKILSGGMHFRIPLLDRVYVQTTRLRVMQGYPQTITAKDGKTITIVMAVGYTITDVVRLYQEMFHPEQSLANMVQGAVADFVSTHTLEECLLPEIEENVKSAMLSGDYGLSFEYVKVTGFAVVKTYRLIQEGHWNPDGITMNDEKK